MSWWPFNFDITLPSFTPPLSIQRRFISFVLKRFLGHLLKPGQLDIAQIDAQIGNGFVEVKDLELDSTAISTFLHTLPLQLQSGSIGTVTVRIPWPNPFTSTIGLSISRLNLTFVLSAPSQALDSVPVGHELADSVASVAETFMHDELSDGEEAMLRDSVHLGSKSVAVAPPGSLDPFLDEDLDEPAGQALPVTVDPEGISIFAGLFEHLLARFELDVTDIVVSLVHAENAVFTLRMNEIRYSTSPDKSSDSGKTEQVASKRSIRIAGFKITMQDLSPSILRSTSPVNSRTTLRHSHSPRSTSSGGMEESDSELDEETHMMMSQSLATLPNPVSSSRAPPLSPSLSTISSTSEASSMYQSAVSASKPLSRPASPHEGNNSADLESQEPSASMMDIIFAVPEPVLICLTTPPPYALPLDTGPESLGDGIAPLQDETLSLDVSVQLVVLALRARHIRRISDCLAAISESSSSNAVDNQGGGKIPPRGPTILDRLACSVDVKGVMSLIMGNTPQVDSATLRNDCEELERFFTKPLIPPRLTYGYVRIHVDSIHTQLSAPISSLHSLHDTFPPLLAHNKLAYCTVSDISIFAFSSSQHSSNNDNQLLSSPILITDQHLQASYLPTNSSRTQQSSAQHNHPLSEGEKGRRLPSFDITDWTDEKGRSHGASLRPWRIKQQTHNAKSDSDGRVTCGFVSNVGLSTSPGSPKYEGPRALLSPPRFSGSMRHAPHPPKSALPISSPAVILEVLSSDDESQRTIRLEMLPLHIFVDLKQIAFVVSFADEAFRPSFSEQISGQLSNQPGRNPPSEVPESAAARGMGEESRKLERLILQDLDLSLDYRDAESKRLPKGNVVSSPSEDFNRPHMARHPVYSGVKGSRSSSPNKLTHIVVSVPLVRIEVRVMPTTGQPCRSGSFVIDLHGISFSSNGLPETSQRTTRFEGRMDDANDDWHVDYVGREAMSTVFQRIVVAYAAPQQSKAQAFLSLGPTGVTDDPTHLPLLIFCAKSLSASQATITDAPIAESPASLLVRIPSIHVALSKDLLDGLQFWADDVTQWAAGIGDTSGESRNSSANNSTGVSRNPSIIGSRYFVRRGGSGSTDSGTVNPTVSEQNEFVVKVVLSKAFVRLLMPPNMPKGNGSIRLLDVNAGDIDVLVETKPEGKEETIVTLAVSNMDIEETHSEETHSIIRTRSPDEAAFQQPALKLRFHSITLPQTTAKESRVRLALYGLTAHFWSDLEWISDLSSFAKAPPGAFETVVPSERTRLQITLSETSLYLTPPTQPSALVLSLLDVGFTTDLVGDSPETAFGVSGAQMDLFFMDDCGTLPKNEELSKSFSAGADHWAELGYVLIANIEDFNVDIRHDTSLNPTDVRVTVDGLNLVVHLCADTVSGIVKFGSDVQSVLSEAPSPPPPVSQSKGRPTTISLTASSNLLRSLDEEAFSRKVPEIGQTPDLISDDLPRNPEYLDAFFGAAAGLRPLDDDELDDFLTDDTTPEISASNVGVTKFGGETIKMLQPTIDIIENFYDTLPPGPLDNTPDYGETVIRVRLHQLNCRLLLYDGYDWSRTRITIQEEVKKVKRRLAKIRQLLANGQAYDPSVDEVNTLLFNSVYVGLDQEAEDLEPGALIAKIDEQLIDDQDDLASESSWQSFKPKVTSPKPRQQSLPAKANRLSRSRGPSIEFSLQSFNAEFDQYRAKNPLVSRLLFTLRDVEILDHIKSSTWSTFLTQLRSDSRGNIREADSNMVRVELQTLLPSAGHDNEEARLKAKLLPLRLHVDQDALDFLKKFFSFSDTSTMPSPPSANEIFFQHAEVFPVDIKLDYKPRRVDYRALREGKTIELMNFFHFDGAEMTLRHITLKGITGWPRFFDSLNDLWTPDVKANQLVDVISGVSPIRSVVNVGSGVADLVLLPIAQYKKDGRIIRGLQKGTQAFVKSTAMEAIKLGAQLATGTQVVLEQAENFLGGKGAVTAETLLLSPEMIQQADIPSDHEDSDTELISRYAEQPRNIKEGVQSASKAMAKNLKYAGQTILAVPMEVYERSSNEGPARAVIRAVPIAVLKPMIGATEAVSKTLLGLRNTLDPSIPGETEVKYKHR